MSVFARVLWSDFGYLSLIAALEHATLHCARFIYAKNSHLIYETDTGRSGLVGCILLLPIVLPMKFEAIRAKVRNACPRIGFGVCFFLT